MLAIISPSKDLDYKSELPFRSTDIPRLTNQSFELIQHLQKKNSKTLMKLMDISEKLAQENVLRFQNFKSDFTAENSRPAIYAFAGDVYRGLDAYRLNEKQIQYAKHHVRILSGLYGLLRPMDQIQPYRLEMGVALKINRKKNLYAFWGDQITQLLKADIQDENSKVLINLASQEYAAALDFAALGVPVIQIQFREYKNGTLRFVSYTAKKARGLMLRFMIQNNLKKQDELKEFNLEDYSYDPELSSMKEWFFIR